MSLLDTASLLLTPNAYKEGKLYSVIPSDGSGDFTFTRATTATRVNSDGLVELVPYNLFTYSEQFDNAAWTKAGTNPPVVTANQGIAPDGTLTADRLLMPSTATTSIAFQNISHTSGTVYTISAYVKTNTSVNQTFRIYGDASISISTTLTATSDWQRFTFTYTASATGSRSAGFYYIPNTQSDLLVWGAQLVEGTNALPYQKTETRLNIPRLDYSLGGCPSILLEPQRTNLALQSSSFDSATWTKFNTTIVANNAISPSGVQDADSMVENTATNLHLIYQSFTSVSSTTYTYSCYIKPNERTRAYLRTDISVGTKRTLFDLTGSGSVVSLAHDSATIKLLDNGYYYCTVTFTEGTGGSRLMAIEGAVGTSVNYTGNGLTAFYLWAAQLEAGSYATSYIPTTSASVTRNLDSCFKTGATALIGQTEGTMYLDFVYSHSNIAIAEVFSLSDGTSNNRIYLGSVFSNDLTASVITSSVVQFTATTPMVVGQRYKVALSYKANDFALYVNGTLIATDNSGTIPTTSQIQNNSGSGASPFYHPIKSAVIWKERLTNEQLAQLTTL